MRILVVTQYFWPENFRINDLVLGLKERGHEVLVLTGKPNYPSGSFFEGYSFWTNSEESWNGVKVYRSKLIPRGSGKGFRLILNYFSFAIFSLISVFRIKERPDCILVYEPSPITVGLPAILAKRVFRAPVYFWVQDIWPHSLSSAGNVRNKFILRAIDGLTRWIYSSCAKILIQSEAFRPIIETQGVDPKKIVYFPNWAEEYYLPLEKDPKYTKYFTGEYHFVFAGNIGEAQDFETLLLSASLLKNKIPTLHWIILGTGRMINYVEKRINELNLNDCFKLVGSFPSIEMPSFFSHADALIVSLKKDPIFSITIPSKVQSYLACGKPIITSLDGEGSRIVMEAQAGRVSPASSPQELAHKMSEFLSLNKDARNKMGLNARNYYDKVFDRNKLIEKLLDIMSVR